MGAQIEMKASEVEDMTTNGDGSSFVAGKNLFCLLGLAFETQCIKEVAKPVLDELEVIRLRRSIGNDVVGHF